MCVISKVKVESQKTWNVMTKSPVIIKTEVGYPPESIMHCKRSIWLRLTHPAKKGRQMFQDKARSCACGKPADKLEWFYFKSPKETWKTGHGKAGWMTFCPSCKCQIDFFVEEPAAGRSS